MKPTQPNTFGGWLANQTTRNDPVGDLARDFVEPCGHPRPVTADDMYQELERHGAIPAAFRAFDRARTEWRQANAAK